jgi:hypothetical protein
VPWNQPGRRSKLKENSRLHTRPRTGSESATTVHEDTAFQNIGSHVHAAKPNKNSLGRHRTAGPSGSAAHAPQCVSSHVTITRTTSVTRTNVTCDRGIRVTRAPHWRGGCGASTGCSCRADRPAIPLCRRPPQARWASPPWPAAQTGARKATARCRPTN